MASTACFVQRGLSVHTCTFDPDMALNAVYTEKFLQCNTAFFYIHILCMMCIIDYNCVYSLHTSITVYLELS